MTNEKRTLINLRRVYCSFLPETNRFLGFEDVTSQLQLYRKISIYELSDGKINISLSEGSLIIEMGGMHKTQISPTGGEDGIDFVGGGEIARNHGGNSRFAVKPVAEGGQEAGPVSRVGVKGCLPGQYFDDIAAMRLEQLGSDYGLVEIKAPLNAISGSQGHRERFLFRPGRPHGVEEFEGKAEPIF